MNKKIIAVILGLLVIIAVAVTGQLFNVKSIEVSYVGEENLDIDTKKVAELSQISVGQNIFTIDENVAEDTIEGYYTNMLKVNDIERVFPNKVVIYVEARDLLFSVKDGQNNTYVTDCDFQVNGIKVNPNADMSKDGELIAINGVTITNTFNISQLKIAKQIVSGFKTLGFDDIGLKRFVKSFDFSNDIVTITLRQYEGTTITLGINTQDPNSMISTLSASLTKLYQYNDADRAGKTL